MKKKRITNLHDSLHEFAQETITLDDALALLDEAPPPDEEPFEDYPAETSDIIYEEIMEEFSALQQPDETIPPHLTSRKEIPFCVLRKLGEGKKLDNLLNGMTTCGCGKNFTEPVGGDDEDDYSSTRMNKE